MTDHEAWSPGVIDPLLEAALFVAGEPLTVERLRCLFDIEGEPPPPSPKAIKSALTRISQLYADRGVELKQVAGGYRFQAKVEYAERLYKLWEQRPPKYSPALLETLSIIVYRQPVTRGDIESLRGVSVSTSIMKTLQDRGWVQVVGSREVPGKPALFGTTQQFLNDFNLTSLSDLPPLPTVAAAECQLEACPTDTSLPC